MDPSEDANIPPQPPQGNDSQHDATSGSKVSLKALWKSTSREKVSKHAKVAPVGKSAVKKGPPNLANLKTPSSASLNINNGNVTKQKEVNNNPHTAEHSEGNHVEMQDICVDHLVTMEAANKSHHSKLQLPTRTSLDYLSPEENPNKAPRPSMVSMQSRRLSNVSTMSHRSQDSNASFSMSQGALHNFMDEQVTPNSMGKLSSSNESYIRTMIPCLPMAASIFCLVLNICVPGSGTFVSGFLTICLNDKKQEGKRSSKGSVIITNMAVGLSQLCTVTFLLVGWFWSLAWGIYMINHSLEHRHYEKQQRQRQLQQKTLNVLLRSERASAAPNSSGGAPGLKSIFSPSGTGTSVAGTPTT